MAAATRERPAARHRKESLPMQTHATSFTPELDPHFGVVVADGYGIKIHVWRRQLVIEDGFGRDRRRRTYARATARLRRLVLLGHTGYVTLEAINWLDGIGAALVQVDKDGRLVLTSSGVGRDHAGLRRAQARAAGIEAGLEIARRLLVRKLAGQVETLRALGLQSAGDELRGFVARAEGTQGLEGVLAAEASGAKMYWEALAAVPVRFPRAELPKIPDHWRTVGGRRSPVGGRNRNAANPANAMLNYLYRLAEAEGTLALATVGLDPGVGIWHVDTAGRDSLTLDILEAIRPKVDRYLCELLAERTFWWRDFHENSHGVCRILAPLTHELAATMPMLASWVAPVAEDVAHAIDGSADPPVFVGTRLSGDGISRSKDGVRVGERPKRRVRPPHRSVRCQVCGAVLADAERQICDRCLPDYDQERTGKLVRAGRATLAAMRASADDPARSPEAAAKKREKSRSTSLAMRAWEREHSRADPTVYEREIRPVIQTMTVPQLMKLTGLSQFHCWKVRKGDRRLHARHWTNVLAVGSREKPGG
jgi:CRISPR-associated endonuclease Cas1